MGDFLGFLAKIVSTKENPGFEKLIFDQNFNPIFDQNEISKKYFKFTTPKEHENYINTKGFLLIFLLSSHQRRYNF